MSHRADDRSKKLADPGVLESDEPSRSTTPAPASPPSPTSYRLIFEPRDPESRRSKTPRNRPAVEPDPEATVVQQRSVEQLAAPPTPGLYRPGDLLARRYRLIEPLGEGGMGSVWRAHSLGLDVDVALKLIRPDTEMPHAEERLKKEARAAARVVHPAAVRVFDYLLTDAGEPFLVMELLQGTPLSKRIADAGPLPPAAAVQTILPIVGALAAAHREGIVHRDVKPANIMLVEEGGRILPKLIDFGIVGMAQGAGLQKLTVRGMMLGSPVYMAPEQVRSDGGDPDERTDVWGVCVTLYELLSGERAFQAATAREAVVSILNLPVSCPAALAGEPALWAILERGLAKKPAHRWASMTELGRALAAWGIQRGVISDASGASLAAFWLTGPG